MRRNRRINFECEGESGATVFHGNERLGAGADRFEEGREFEAEGFAGLDGDFAQR
jgi:hypothetical protein